MVKQLSPRTLALLTGLLAQAPASEACAPAPEAGHSVRIEGEEAVIVWDPASRTEHFIRRASFRTTSPTFGFLVPTPTLPTLTEAPDLDFQHLYERTLPRVAYRTVTGIAPTLSCLMFMLASRGADEQAPTAPVRVLHQQRVAGYDATVLEADDAGALARWLEDHHYPTYPQLTTWLELYVRNHWKLTAFRIAGDSGGAPSSAAVRMTFQTERPFYPYREPSNQREGPASPRSLRVYFVSDARYAGALGAGPWPGRLFYARPMSSLAAGVAGVPAAAMPPHPWLAAFDDLSSPRPGTDEVYFSPSPDAAEVTPPVALRTRSDKIPVPLDLVAIPSLGAYLWWRRRRRKNR